MFLPETIRRMIHRSRAELDGAAIPCVKCVLWGASVAVVVVPGATRRHGGKHVNGLLCSHGCCQWHLRAGQAHWPLCQWQGMGWILLWRGVLICSVVMLYANQLHEGQKCAQWVDSYKPDVICCAVCIDMMFPSPSKFPQGLKSLKQIQWIYKTTEKCLGLRCIFKVMTTTFVCFTVKRIYYIEMKIILHTMWK